ncbi:uncharacterized protein LOC120419853 [Culex pipiens pallens]|uniref:uncharacterized protein LOC120419853 n=1 Tax=Culex pipiens pallens TaxID=42434 RepID=UPI0022AB44AE|nr:uncharacterized protein LOC120419853 [Culex pipiens pallens]
MGGAIKTLALYKRKISWNSSKIPFFSQKVRESSPAMTIVSTKVAVLFLLLVCIILQLAHRVKCKSVNQERTLSREKSPQDGDVGDESGSFEVFSEDRSEGSPTKSEKNIEVRGVLKGVFGAGNGGARSGGEGWDQRRREGGGGRDYGYDDRRRRPNDRRNEPCLVVREEDGHHHHHNRHHDG